MEFTIKQKVLNEALSAVRGSLEPKTTIPVLANFLIESMGENAIRITGTDLDIYIRKTVEANIVVPGVMCVNARKLSDVVAKPPDGDCYLRREKNDWVVMKSGRSSYKFAATSHENFPEIPAFKSTPIKLPTAILRDLIQHTVFAIDKVGNRYATQGGKLEVGGGQVRAIATDGHRMGFAMRAVDVNGSKLDSLLTKKALTEALKFDCEEVSIGEEGGKFFIDGGDQLIIARMVTGSFPNYEKVLPKSHDQTAYVKCGDFADALRRAAFMADERNRSIRITFRQGEMEIKAAASETGEGVEFVDVDYKGEEITFGFQWVYVLEFLNIIDAEKKLRLTFKSYREAFEMAVDGDDAYRYIVMPLQL